jgi:ADP-ribose pyrophosphatase YjhB (NUDIX family)
MPYQYFSDPSARDRPTFAYCPRCGQALSSGAAASPSASQRQACEACGYVSYFNPIPGAVCIIRNEEGKALIGLRSRASDCGEKWCLPGGYIEGRESFLEATVREVKEETNLDIALEGIVNVVSNDLAGGHDTIVIVMLARAEGGTMKPMDDITELRWIDGDEHARVEYAFEADRRILDDYFSGRLEKIDIDGRFSERWAGRRAH